MKYLEISFWSSVLVIDSFFHPLRLLVIDFFFLDEVKNAVSLYCEINYDFLKIFNKKNYSFFNTLIVDVWQVLEYILDFRYPSALNIPGLWMCQGSEYACGSEYVRVLDLLRF